MNGLINYAVMEQTSFDSARPSGTAVVVHRFRTEGRYSVALSSAGYEIPTSLTIVVEPSGTEAGKAGVGARPTPIAAPPSGAALDVSGSAHASELPVSRATGPDAAVLAGGYVSFSAPPGRANRFVVTLIEASGEREEELDSERLRPTDFFALALVRPGTYVMRNTLAGYQGRIVVTYPEVGDQPYRPGDPVRLTCEEGGFSSEAITVGPTQGIVFEAAVDSRITIELVDPDDGPRVPVVERVPRVGKAASKPAKKQKKGGA